VYGITSGTTEAVGTWKVTVVDGTHLDLQGSTFTHAYVSGGTITNGSGFITNGVDAVGLYFSTVVQFKNLLFGTTGSGNGISLQWGSKAYLLDGCLFYGAANEHILVADNAYLECDARYGIAGYSQYHVVVSLGGTFVGNAVDFAPTAGGTFSSAFVLVSGPSSASFGSINLNGAVVAGVRWQLEGPGSLATATGAPNADLPGSSNGQGGQLLGTGSNDSAVSGNVGEVQSTSVLLGAATGLVSGTPANV